jgi:hypothetical protein
VPLAIDGRVGAGHDGGSVGVAGLG